MSECGTDDGFRADNLVTAIDKVESDKEKICIAMNCQMGIACNLEGV
jgi:hypothetical protein